MATARLLDADQTSADADQAAADQDGQHARADQLLSDRDQASADRDHLGAADAAAQHQYETTRAARQKVSLERNVTQLERRRTAEDREVAARARDEQATRRDQRARERDVVAAPLEQSLAELEPVLAERIMRLREQAAADRTEAAGDRERAARDRHAAAHERARLERELLTAHLDDLTGAYRRDMGQLAVSHELDRARRGDGRFVLAFVDVDDLKLINDRDGHAAGDRALQTVVSTMRRALRSYDPIYRYGGDEFVAGMSGTDLDQAELRFEAIQATLERDAGITISVGLAPLAGTETADGLVARADLALSRRKGSRRNGHRLE